MQQTNAQDAITEKSKLNLANQKYLSTSSYVHWHNLKSIVNFELSKDPELYARFVLPKTKRNSFALSGGLKLNDGFTKLYSSSGFENFKYDLGFEWVFTFLSRSDNPNYTLRDQDGEEYFAWKKEGWFSLKGGFEKTNCTLFSPFSGNVGNPLNNMSVQQSGTATVKATYFRNWISPRGRANVFWNNSVTWKPSDNNISDLDDFTLNTIQVITDPTTGSVYNLTTDSKTGKYGTIKTINSIGLKTDFSLVFGVKQDFALNLLGNYVFKDGYQNFTIETGFYFPIKTTKGDDENSKFANLGIIAKTKDLNAQGSFSSKLVYGIKIGFPISK